MGSSAAPWANDPVEPWHSDPLDKPQASAAGDVLRGIGDKINPLNMIKGAEDTLKAIREQPFEVAKQIFLHPYMAVSRGLDALKAGKPEEAAAHFNSALAPPGSGIEEASVEGATPGQRATGLGHALGIGATAYAGAKLPEVPGMVSDAAKAGAAKIAGAAGGLDPDIVGLVSPRTAHLLRIVKKVSAAGDMASDAQPASISPPVLPASTGPLPDNSANVPRFSTGEPIDSELLDGIVQGMKLKGITKFSQLKDAPAAQELALEWAKRMKPQNMAPEQAASPVNTAAVPIQQPQAAPGPVPAIDERPPFREPVAPRNWSRWNQLPGEPPAAVNIPQNPTAGSETSALLDKLQAAVKRPDDFAPNIHKSPATVARQLEGKGTLAEGAVYKPIPDPSKNPQAMEISKQLKDMLKDGKTIRLSPAYFEMLKNNPEAARLSMRLAIEMAK